MRGTPTAKIETHYEALLTVDQVAEHLQLPVATLYRYRHRGEGPRAARVGRHLRYRRADVEEWVEQQYDQPRPAA